MKLSNLGEDEIAKVLLKRFNRMNLKYKVMLMHSLKYGTEYNEIGDLLGLDRRQTIAMFTTVKTLLLRGVKNGK